MNRTSDHDRHRSATRDAPGTCAPDEPVAPGPVGIPAQRRPTAQEEQPDAEHGELHGCRCGHPSSSHDHFRAGTDCAVCDCGRYVSTTGLAHQLAAILRRQH